MYRVLRLLVWVILFVPEAWAQSAGGVLTQTPAEDDAHRWAFTASAYGYLVPDDQSYFSPIFSADHDWLHVEARYNYEDQRTGSIWVGYNFRAGQRLTLEATPMFGAVFGNTTGVAPGYEISLAYKKVEFSSQGEYVVDFENHTRNFFYSWNELVYSPTDWFHAGLVAQHTRAYESPLDIQRGVSVGFSHRRVDFTTYIFNFGWTDPTVVLGLGFTF
jgi:hypothetical protein